MPITATGATGAVPAFDGNRQTANRLLRFSVSVETRRGPLSSPVITVTACLGGPKTGGSPARDVGQRFFRT